MLRKFTVDNNSYTEISTESLRRYLNDVSSIEEKLTDEQQKDLIDRYYYHGDEQAKKELIEGNLRFVISVAKQYNVSTVDFDDLVNEGNIGLQEAIERFDPDKGVRFISYAVWWIRRNIIMFLNENSRSVKLPLNRITDIFKVDEAKDILAQRLSREPTVAEIKNYVAEHYNMNGDDVEKAIKNNEMKDESLEKPVKQGGDDDAEKTFLEVIPNSNADDPENRVKEDDEDEVLGHIFSKLDRLERQVIDLCYGITTKVPLPLQEVGEEIGGSGELVRQIKNKAEEKLKEEIDDPRKLLHDN